MLGGEQYAEGQILEHAEVENDSLAQFNLHADSVYMVNVRPVEPFNVFASGDGNDKAYVWRV